MNEPAKSERSRAPAKKATSRSRSRAENPSTRESRPGTLHKVTMNLSHADISNTERLRDRMDARSNAQVVSTAIAVTAVLADMVDEGGVLLVRDKNGEIQRIRIPGLI